MTIARIEGGAVVEIREMALDDVPPHKRGAWRPVIGEPPAVDPRLATRAADPVYTIADDHVRRDWPVTPKPLDEVRAFFLRRVDADAEAARLRFITPGYGMAVTYQEKFAQAQAVEDLGRDAANALSQADREAQFPTLSASVGIEADTLWDCAVLVLQRYTGFARVSMLIERQRLAAKKAIRAAADGAEVAAIYEAMQWPTP